MNRCDDCLWADADRGTCGMKTRNGVGECAAFLPLITEQEQKQIDAAVAACERQAAKRMLAQQTAERN